MQAQPYAKHNQKTAAMWRDAGRTYDDVSRDLDVATGTGWTSRRVTMIRNNMIGVSMTALLTVGLTIGLLAGTAGN